MLADYKKTAAARCDSMEYTRETLMRLHLFGVLLAAIVTFTSIIYFLLFLFKENVRVCVCCHVLLKLFIISPKKHEKKRN